MGLISAIKKWLTPPVDPMIEFNRQRATFINGLRNLERRGGKLMNKPVFPVKFVKRHCLKVLEARDWRKIYKVKDRTDDDDMEFAECAFNPAGSGLECENCGKFICSIKPRNEADDFVDEIKQFYKDMEVYEKGLAKEEAEKLEIGGGI